MTSNYDQAQAALTCSVAFLNEEEDERKIVLDNGTDLCRIGFANADAPRAVFPPCLSDGGVGSGHDDGAGVSGVGGDGGDGIRVGYQSTYPKHYPMERGIITNWEAMEKVWHHAFHNELRVAPQNYKLLISDRLFSPKCQREKTLEIMMEKFEVGGFMVTSSALLALYSNGRDSGVVVESGAGVTTALPIQDSCVIAHAVQRCDMGGRDVTDHLVGMLKRRGYSFATQSEWDLVNKMKEKMCFVAPDVEWSNEKLNNGEYEAKSFQLPDGSSIILGHEMFKAPEILFDPSQLQHTATTSRRSTNCLSGIPEMIKKCVSSCESDGARAILCSSILISGGNSMIRGFNERIFPTVHNMFPEQMRVRTICTPERRFSTWIGGAILASLSHNNNNTWIDREDYDEYGPSVVHRLCRF